MSDYDNAVFRLATAQEAEPEDYTGEDGLLYCGSCRQPKEAYFAEGKTLFGRDRHPKECDCQRKRREMLETADREHKHREEVERRREWYLREYSWDKVAQRICSVMEKNERDKDQYRSAGV